MTPGSSVHWKHPVDDMKVRLSASYYQQFDADYGLPAPAEGYGGWQQSDVEIDLAHTGVVIMHALAHGTPELYPGWFRAVEYMTRANEIQRTVFPGLLSAVRARDIALFHVAGSGDYPREYPGYLRASRLAGPEPMLEQIPSDPVLEELRRFRARHVFVGAHNQADTEQGTKSAGFPPEALPLGDEGVAQTARQLFALCKERQVNHLIYAGFAVNWCMLVSPGGMVDMARRGMMCSVLRQAVTAVENKETVRSQLNKQLALWRVSVGFGFVFDVDDFVQVISTSETESEGQ